MDMLDKLFQRGSSFLGVKYPVISGAMTWISTPELVRAVCAGGGFGVLAGGNMPPELLDKEIARCRAMVPGAFGVNLITIAANYKQHLEIVEKHDAPVVVFAGAIPAQADIERMKLAGKKVLAFAPAEALAKRMLKFGADGLIIEGSEAGGHIGHSSTIVLLQEILFRFGADVPVFVAGGVADGRMLAHLMLMGAAGVQLGTRFVMTEESQVHPDMKKAFCRAQARHAAATTQVDPRLPIVSVRAIRNKASEDFAKMQIDLISKIERGETTREAALEQVEHFWIGGLRKAVVDGDIENGSVMAGQSVGLMDEILPMAEVFTRLMNEARAELDAVRARMA